MSQSPTVFGVVDFETTDREPKNAHVVEWAAVLWEPRTFEPDKFWNCARLVKPPVPIPAETSAIHHIIAEDVESMNPWEVEGPRMAEALKDAHVLVAHNADFEKHFLAPLMPAKRWICTYKCSLRAFPDAPSHSNEGLRYYLELGSNRGRAGMQHPHTALHDTWVTALLLMRLLQEHKVEQLLEWSDQGAVLPRCPIGKWRGAKWSEIDYGFLEWIVYKAWDMRPDVLNTAKLEMERRHNDSDRLNPEDEVEVM